MKYYCLILFRFTSFLIFAFWATNIALAQQKENYQPLEKDKSVDFYLQKGHQAGRDGDIEKAITLYKKALAVNPDYSAAKFSLESALSKLELKKWALRTLPVECRFPSQHFDINVAIKCAEKYFSFNGQPINPKIIRALSAWLSDGGDQIVSVNLYDSQNSNRFCCEDDIKIRKTAENQIIYFSKDNTEFGYQYIGKSESGIHVIYTYDWGGGSGIFKRIMLITMESDYGIIFDKKNSIIKATLPRLLLKKLGEVSLGDRWSGDLKIDGNNLFIGKDKGWFSGRKYGGQFSDKPKDRVIKIDISR